MKIQILSDLHNEFLRNDRHNPYHKWSGKIPDTDADLIILAGDIDIGTKGVEWAISESKRLRKDIIYVPGNHEYYGQEYFSHCDKISRLAENTRVHCLNPGVYKRDNFRIIGATLWTDYKVDNATPQELAMYYIERSLADHRKIKFNTGDAIRNFLPSDALALHTKEVNWIEQQLLSSFEGKTIIVSHHGPHPICQHTSFHVNEMSAAFQSDLSYLMEQYDIDIWIYGHTHSNLDEVILDTRIISNQAGNPAENIDDFDADCTVDI